MGPPHSDTDHHQTRDCCHSVNWIIRITEIHTTLSQLCIEQWWGGSLLRSWAVVYDSWRASLRRHELLRWMKINQNNWRNIQYLSRVSGNQSTDIMKPVKGRLSHSGTPVVWWRWWPDSGQWEGGELPVKTEFSWYRCWDIPRLYKDTTNERY